MMTLFFLDILDIKYLFDGNCKMIAWLRIFIYTESCVKFLLYIFSRIENSHIYMYIFFYRYAFSRISFVEREIKISLGRNAHLLIRSFPIGRKGMT